MTKHAWTGIGVMLAAASAVVACSNSNAGSAENVASATAAWSCYSVAVPGGASMQCDHDGAHADASAGGDYGEYDCAPGAPASDKCPPSEPDAETDPDDGTCQAPDVSIDDDDWCWCAGHGGKGGKGDDGGKGDKGGKGGKGSSSSGGACGVPWGGWVPGCLPNWSWPWDDKSGGSTCSGDCNGSVDAGGKGGKGGNKGGKGGGKGGYKCKSKGGKGSCRATEPECSPGSHPAPCGACVPDGQTDCQPPAAGGCWVTGGGVVADKDGEASCGGNVLPMKGGSIGGHWNHVDHACGKKLDGDVTYLKCDESGSGASYGGECSWFEPGKGWRNGYWFDVELSDQDGRGHQATKSRASLAVKADTYHLVVRKLEKGKPGALVYEKTGSLAGGNFMLQSPDK